MTNYHQEQPAPMPRTGRGGGNTCLIIGGIGCLFLILILVVLGVVGYFGAQSLVANLVDQFTETSPVPLPALVLPQDRIDSAMRRYDEFKAALTSGQPIPPLELTADDANALIQNHPDWAMIKDQAHVTFEDDKVQAQVSVSLEPFAAVPLFGKYVKGRYFNGSATFDVFVRNGLLFLTLHSAVVKDRALPPEAIAELRQQNLAKDIRQNPDIAAMLDRIERLEVSGGVLTIVPKDGASDVSAPPGLEEPAPAPLEAIESPT